MNEPPPLAAHLNTQCPTSSSEPMKLSDISSPTIKNESNFYKVSVGIGIIRIIMFIYGCMSPQSLIPFFGFICVWLFEYPLFDVGTSKRVFPGVLWLLGGFL